MLLRNEEKKIIYENGSRGYQASGMRRIVRVEEIRMAKKE